MSSPEVDLVVDWCSHAAAKYAVEHWHYSRRTPIGKLVRLGVWEDSLFVGAIVFSRGNTPTLGARFGLSQTQVCELVRVALRGLVSWFSHVVATLVGLFSRFQETTLMLW